MRRVVLARLEHFAFEDVPIPAPGADEVVLKVERVGICGSDVHLYYGHYPNVKLPMVLGHEFSGSIHSIGAEVRGVRIGDSVTAEPGIPCGKCIYCQSGHYNVCVGQHFVGGRPDEDGAYADYVRVPATQLIALPEGMTFEVGAMVEPLAVAMHALDVAQMTGGDVTMIIGAGTIGLLIAQAVRMAGAKTVIVADLVPERLALAKQLGADAIVNVQEADLTTWSKATYGEGAITRIFDTASTARTFQQALEIVRRRGRVINVGEATKPVEFQRDMLGREIELTGVHQYMRPNFDQAVEAIVNCRVQVEPLISAVYPLGRIADAYDIVLHNPKYVKVMLAPQLG